MKKVFNWFVFLFVAFGFIVLGWAYYSMSVDTYRFWKYGIEKEALVVDLDHTSSSSKGGTTYYYKIQIDGDELVSSFSYKLPIERYITVLVVPDAPNKVSIGNENSSLFEIFSYMIGGRIMAFLSIGLFFLVIFSGPSALVQIYNGARSS